jgi:catechol 2,3-dioxygenase-like lactoylglutathione lyase family enzyme
MSLLLYAASLGAETDWRVFCVGVLMNAHPFQIKGLGEVAIRCRDLDTMVEFYSFVLGLERLNGNESDAIVFFRIADGFDGHTTVLALFDHVSERAMLQGRGSGVPEAGTGSSLHHLALTVSFEQQDAIIDWYTELGLEFSIQEFDWVGWRGIFTNDPDGNTVELVAYDPALLRAGEAKSTLFPEQQLTVK